MGDNEFLINDFLRQAVSVGASDIHLCVGDRPAIRAGGQIMRINLPVLTVQDLDNAIKTIAPNNLKDKISKFFDIDFSYEIPEFSRFRVNLNHQLGKSALVLRVIPFHAKTFAELHMPESIEKFANFNNGLVLVTGPTGSGKSTTIASLIDYINTKFAKHIITIEDPVEFIFENKKSIVSQRQLIVDTPTFAEGVKYALRQDPDVIFIGEIRDRETMEAALSAAETGHLVVSTIHTNNAVQTVSRIMNFFEPEERDYIRQQLSSSLRGTIAQKLVPIEGSNVRVPIPEILVVTPAAADFIEKGQLDKIYDLVKSGSYDNMITMNMSLYKLYQDGKISKETALYYSDSKQELEQMIRGVYYGTGINKSY